MTKQNQAVGLFHGKEKFNCTQAVLKTFQPESGVSDAAILAAARAGGGKALDGYCGALHAARVILDTPAAHDVEERFKDVAGSYCCRDIKKAKSLTCRECVALSAKLVEEYADELPHGDAAFMARLEERVAQYLP